MDDAKIRIRLWILMCLVALHFFVWVLPQLVTETHASYLQVAFLDIGQGDAIFVETPDGVQVLIDGGQNAAVVRELGSQMGFFDRTIDVVIATHPDSDHVGGLIDVLKRYQVDLIVTTENKGTSEAAQLFELLRNAEGAEHVQAQRGQILQLGASTTMEVLWPEGDSETMESNRSSIVLKLVYGTTSVMLTGDAPKSVEEYLVLAYGEHLQSTILKVGHHGSRTSTSELFLDEVAPRYAVISAGENNRYGHPHTEVTDLLFNKRISTFTTFEQGSLTFISDGHEFKLQ